MSRCYCPSQGDGPVRMVTHLAGCRFLEDLGGGASCDDDAARRPAGPGPAAQALAETCREHAEGLAAIDAAYADRSWMEDL